MIRAKGSNGAMQRDAADTRTVDRFIDLTLMSSSALVEFHRDLPRSPEAVGRYGRWLRVADPKADMAIMAAW